MLKLTKLDNIYVGVIKVWNTGIKHNFIIAH